MGHYRFGLGTTLAVGGLLIPQVHTLIIEHTNNRLRVRLFDQPESEAIRFLKELGRDTKTHVLVTTVDGEVAFSHYCKLLLCRTKFKHDSAVAVSLLFQAV